MRLLYVTEGMPTRDRIHGDGSSLITYEVIKHMPEDVEVHLLAFKSSPVEMPEEVRRRCRSVTLLDLKSSRVALFQSLASGLSRGALERRTLAAQQAVRTLSASADVTIIHGPNVAHLAHSVVGPLIVQIVDPWSARQLLAAEHRTGLARQYRTFRAWQSRRFERRLPASAILLTVGRRDADLWSRALHREVIPVGLGSRQLDALWTRPPGRPTLCFVGSLNYAPNVESAHILVKEIAPLVRARLSDIRILLAGRQPDISVLDLASHDVEVRGDVPNVDEIYLMSHVAVFPDRSGLGIRNAVTEALDVGIPVVASEIAAREQPDHPRLSVGHSLKEIADLAVEAITSRAPVDSFETPERRSWAHIAADYVEMARLATKRSEPASS